MSTRFVYEGDRLSQISFPLGGIGSGSIGLAGNGGLVDWEIRNRPNKGSVHGFSHFAVKAESETDVVDVRVLNGDYPPPYSGPLAGDPFRAFGFGVARERMTGFPHFRSVRFTGQYPVAELDFVDPGFPGDVRLVAFNPLIPGNDRDSSIPAAFFEITVTSTSSDELTYTFAGSLMNPHPGAAAWNEYRRTSTVHEMVLGTKDMDPASTEFGDMTIATDAVDVSFQEYWYRGSWFDNVSVYWQDLSAFGPLANRRYDSLGAQDTVAYGKEDLATLAARVTVAPGESASVRFVIAWSFPNVTNYWNPVKEGETCGGSCDCDGSCDRDGSAACDCRTTWRNYYATLFPDSAASARYCLENWQRLHDETLAFRRALFGSTLPEEVLDAVSANISILKSPTVLRLEDGTFYGFEGCHPLSGCCEGSCTHVWNYAYALPFLFPRLERSMRDVDYRYNEDEHGGMKFRLQLPLGREAGRFRPCADGQFGGIMKMYREWKISGDTEWLRSHWQSIRQNLEYAWSPDNPDRWDLDRDGVLEGRQHHTLDMELFGPNSWLTGFYLGALLAASEMASHLGEQDRADEYRRLFERGSGWVNEHLWNGEYFHQRVDLADRAILEQYRTASDPASIGSGTDVVSTYWDAEHGQLKYQIAEGCGVDQVVAQWHANLMSLGSIFDPEKTKSALQSIYRYNFKKSMRDHVNPCRIYALNDEAALVICAFPGERPVIPVPYAEEAMNGFEYQAACHMIQEGLVDEGLEVVRAVRDRYDGVRRNPWNEFECGSNYARSMASYALLLALSGFEYDMTRGHVGFRPVATERPFRCFWSLDSGWGEVEITDSFVELRVISGSLTLSSFACGDIAGYDSPRATVGGEPVEASTAAETVSFGTTAVVTAERRLRIHRS